MRIHGSRFGSLFFWILIELYAAAVYERRVLHMSDQLMSQTTAIRQMKRHRVTGYACCG